MKWFERPANQYKSGETPQVNDIVDILYEHHDGTTGHVPGAQIRLLEDDLVKYRVNGVHSWAPPAFCTLVSRVGYAHGVLEQLLNAKGLFLRYDKPIREGVEAFTGCEEAYSLHWIEPFERLRVYGGSRTWAIEQAHREYHDAKR